MAEPKHLIDARMEVARVSRANHGADQAEVDAARTRYATAKIDAVIRETVQKTTKGARFDDNQVAQLCGLILGEAGVQYDALKLIEPIIRAAVVQAQKGGGA